MEKPGHDRTCRCDTCEAYRAKKKQDEEVLQTMIEREKKSNFEKLKEATVNHPPHYTSHPSGIEVIQITEHENFCRGNAIKYILRAGKKGSEIEDLKKAGWYINREIERLTNEH